MCPGHPAYPRWCKQCGIGGRGAFHVEMRSLKVSLSCQFLKVNLVSENTVALELLPPII